MTSQMLTTFHLNAIQYALATAEYSQFASPEFTERHVRCTSRFLLLMTVNK